MSERVPPPGPGFCRVAAVQMDFHAAAWLSGASPLRHPWGDPNAGNDWGLGPELPAHQRRTWTALTDAIQSIYLQQLRARLEGILGFLAELGTEVAVLPEYAVPAELLPRLATCLSEHAPNLLLVAGTHGVSPEGAGPKGAYAEAGYEGPDPAPTTAVAPVLHGGKLVALFPKLALTDDEVQGRVTVPATDPPVVRVVPLGPDREVWVAICRDFLELGRASVHGPPRPGRLLVVPALSPEGTIPADFEPKLSDTVKRAQCPVALANGAPDGGTRVWPLPAPGLDLARFPVLAAREEGIVVVDVDLNAYPGARTAPFPARPPSRVVCTTGTLYVARAVDAAHRATVVEGCRLETPGELVSWLAQVSPLADSAPHGRRERWSHLALARGFAHVDEARTLLREVVFEAEILPLATLERALALGAAGALEPLGAQSSKAAALVSELRIAAQKRPAADTTAGRETEARVVAAVAGLAGHFAMARADVAAFDRVAELLDQGRYAQSAREAADLLGRDDLGPALHAAALGGLVAALHGTVWEVPGATDAFEPVPIAEREALLVRACRAARGLFATDTPDSSEGEEQVRRLRQQLLTVVHVPEAVGLPPEASLVMSLPHRGGPWLDGFVEGARGRDPEPLRALFEAYPTAAPVAFMLTEAASRAGDHELALAAAQRAFALVPGAGQRLALAQVFARAQRWSEVIGVIEPALDALGAAGLLTLANARAALGEETRALGDLDALLARDPRDLATALQRHHLARHLEPGAAERAWEAFERADDATRAAVPVMVYRRFAEHLRSAASGGAEARAQLHRRLRAIGEVLSRQLPSLDVDFALLEVTSGLDAHEVEGLRRPQLDRYRGDPRLYVGDGEASFRAFVEELRTQGDRIERLHAAGLVSFEALGLYQPRIWYERAAAIFASDGSLRLPAVPGRPTGTEAPVSLRGPLLLGPLEALLIVQTRLRFEDFAAVLGPGPQFALFEDTLALLHEGARRVLDATFGWRSEEGTEALATLAERVRAWLMGGARAGFITRLERPEVGLRLPSNLREEVRATLWCGLSRWEAIARPELGLWGMAVADEVEIGRRSLLSPFIAFRESWPDREAFRLRLEGAYAGCRERVLSLPELLARAAEGPRRPSVLAKLARWGVSDTLSQPGVEEALVPTSDGTLPAALFEAHERACAGRLAVERSGPVELGIERTLGYAALWKALVTAGREVAATALLDRVERLDTRLDGSLLGTFIALLADARPVLADRDAAAVLDAWCQGSPRRRGTALLAARLPLGVALRLGPAYAVLAADALLTDASTSVSAVFTLDGLHERAVLAALGPDLVRLPALGEVNLGAAVTDAVALAVGDRDRWRVQDAVVVIATDHGPLHLPSAALALRAPPSWVVAHGRALGDAARARDGELADAFASLSDDPESTLSRTALAHAAIDSTARICARSPIALPKMSFVLSRSGSLDTLGALRRVLSEPGSATRDFELRAALAERLADPRWRGDARHALFLRATAIPLSRAVWSGTDGWIEAGAGPASEALAALRRPERMTAVELSRFVYVAGRVAARETWVTSPHGEAVELRPQLLDAVTALLARPPSPTSFDGAAPSDAATEAPLARLALDQLVQLRPSPGEVPAGDAELLYLVGVLRHWMAGVLATSDEGPRRHFFDDLLRRDAARSEDSRHVLNPAGWAADGLDLRTASVLFALVALGQAANADGGWRPSRADLSEALLALAERPLSAVERRLRWPTPEDRALGVEGPVAVADLALVALAQLDPDALPRLSAETRRRRVEELPRGVDDREGAPWEVVWPTLRSVLGTWELGDGSRRVLAERVRDWLDGGVDRPEVAVAVAIVSVAGDEVQVRGALEPIASRNDEAGKAALVALLERTAALGPPVLDSLVQRLLGVGMAPATLALRLATVAISATPEAAQAGRAALLGLAALPEVVDDVRVMGLLKSLGLVPPRLAPSGGEHD